jgi:hypothetical protein
MNTENITPNISQKMHKKFQSPNNLIGFIGIILGFILAFGSLFFQISFQISKLLFFIAFLILGLSLHYFKYLNYFLLFVYLTIFGALTIFINQSLFIKNSNSEPLKIESKLSKDTTKSKPINKTENKIISQKNSPGAVLNAPTTNVTSINQQGGITADKVTIDEFPKPDYFIKTISKNIPIDTLFKTEIRLIVKSETVVSKLYVVCKTPSVITMEINPDDAGMMNSLRGLKTNDGFPCEMIQNASGKYLISIVSSKPDEPIIKLYEKTD